MIELLIPYGFDTLEYSWVKATIGICTLVDYSVAKKHLQLHERRPRHLRCPPGIRPPAHVVEHTQVSEKFQTHFTSWPGLNGSSCFTQTSS
jgi:hypothetical protein